MRKRILWLGLSSLLVAALVLASCGPAPVVEEPVVEEPVVEEPVVEEPVVEEPVIEEPVVVEPVVEEPVVEEVVFLGFPRSETVFVAQLSARVGSPGNFNEWIGWKWRDRGMANLMNEALWTIDYVRGEVVNSLAAAPPEYNDDFTQMTIKLREGVYWSDGVEFTADDVVFTIELNKATPGFNYNAQMQTVESVSAADRYTVVIELTEPNSRFNIYFLDRWGCLWIMPKHVWEQVEDPTLFEYNPPLSLGPYVLHSYDEAGFWTAWERRDDWERTPTGMLFGKPAPKYVVFRDAGEPALQVMALARHELDVAVPITIEASRAALTMDPYATTFYPDLPWWDNFDPAITGLTFNTMKPPFDNSEVRWALVLAIDIVSYSATAFDGAVLISALLTPTVPLYAEYYYEPMQQWLKDFTLDIDNGETFQPYDPDAAYRLAEYVKARGYTVPEDIEATFGYGWWKYAPDVAARLLENNGFSRDEDENWLLPDGTPWKISILTNVTPGHPQYQNAFAGAHEWRRFGIDIEVITSEMMTALNLVGDFDITASWPANEPWGGHLDLSRTFDEWNSVFVEPVLGEPQYGHPSRWSDPRLDEVIAGLKGTDWSDIDGIVELGIAGLKIAVEEMPGIATFNYAGPEAKSTYYWTNWPSAANPYNVSLTHWPNFKYMLPFLEATGR